MFEFWFVVFSVIGISYVLLILWLYLGINRNYALQAIKGKPITGFSIIIAFRNEEKNLESLLQSISELNYPTDLFEVLLVNDTSTDQSESIIQTFISQNKQLNIQLLQNNRKTISPKKDAINTAIATSNYKWILTTDADCFVSKTWLQAYDSFIKNNQTVFIAGLVTYKEKSDFIHQFQHLDWMSLIGVSMGSFGHKKPLMCSGANLAYQKKVFEQVGGFNGNTHIASGDDVFLMQKMQQQFPKQVFYLQAKEVKVITQSLTTWKALLQQRIRWGKKTAGMSNWFIKTVGLLVLLFNTSLIVLVILSLFYQQYVTILLLLFASKLIIDSLFLLKIHKITFQKFPIIVWIVSSFIYPFFSVSVILLGFFSNYTWKGRKFVK